MPRGRCNVKRYKRRGAAKGKELQAGSNRISFGGLPRFPHTHGVYRPHNAALRPRIWAAMACNARLFSEVEAEIEVIRSAGLVLTCTP